VIKGLMRAKTLVILLSLAVLAVTIWPARQLGTEFMPNLNEGTLLYMPTTLPGISGTNAGELMQTQRQDHPVVPGGGLRLWEDRTRGDGNRSGPVRDVRDRRQPEAQGQWRPGVTVDGPTAEIDEALQFPRVKAHIGMLSTGIRTSIGEGDRHRLVEIDKLAKAY
jgi:Cu(I)/Ag(I) efflux system membrane protein CusA/SilA